MNIWEECRAYLADNPSGYWFRRKIYGYGWIPATWQGWTVTGVYLAFVLVLAIASSPERGLVEPKTFIWPVIVATILFIVIAYKTGESPKWQWGIKQDTEHNQ